MIYGTCLLKVSYLLSYVIKKQTVEKGKKLRRWVKEKWGLNVKSIV